MVFNASYVSSVSTILDNELCPNIFVRINEGEENLNNCADYIATCGNIEGSFLCVYNIADYTDNGTSCSDKQFVCYNRLLKTRFLSHCRLGFLKKKEKNGVCALSCHLKYFYFLYH